MLDFRHLNYHIQILNHLGTKKQKLKSLNPQIIPSYSPATLSGLGES
jgi:hypothetical protein